MQLDEMLSDAPTNDIVVTLPFVAAARAASAPALGRFGRLYGSSTVMQDVYRMIEKVAPTEATVFITGESGCGKELVARTIHERSPRARGAFVAINCGAIPQNLIEAELFGHERGAFTGANRQHRGCFERAEGGTLFLDEITEMPLEMQVRLLRVLETGTFRRVGGTVDIKVDVRIIAATNRSLESMMKEGQFREDLFYRLNVFSVHIPPLRERRDDIPPLVEHFIRNSSIVPKRTITVSPEAMEVLQRYTWPGNVRELENVVERALILCDGGVVEPEHLPMGVRLTPAFEPEGDDNELLELEEVERRYIKRVLEMCKGHRHRAAAILGISERNLYRKLKEIEELAEP